YESDGVECRWRRDIHISQVSPTRQASRSRVLRARASATPAAAGNPNDRNAPAAPLSSAPILAGIHPAAIFTSLVAASSPRILPPRNGSLRNQNPVTTSAATSSWHPRPSRNI